MRLIPAVFVGEVDHGSGAERFMADVLVAAVVEERLLDVDDAGEQDGVL